MKTNNLKILLFIALTVCLAFPGIQNSNAQDSNGPENNLDPVQVADELIGTIPNDAVKTAEGFTESGYWTNLFDVVWYAIIVFLLLEFKIPQKLFLFCERKFKKQWLQKLTFIPLILLTLYAFSWPINLYDGFFRETFYGFSNQSLSEWFIEHWISVIFSTALFTPIILLIFWFLNRFQKLLWVWVSLVMTGFLVFLLVITPVVIDPLSNDYFPIEDRQLKTDLLTLAQENGFEIDEIYTFDTSTNSTTMNAKVTGLFGTARISINDNMLNAASPGEIKMVVAHEMGHLVLGHLSILILIFIPLIFFGFWLLFYLFEKIIKIKGNKWGIYNITEIQSLPLSIALYFFVSTILLPPIYGAQRYIEIEADAFALDLTQDPDNFTSVLLKTAGRKKVNPGKIEEFFLYDHPSLKNRLLFGLNWKVKNQ